MHTEIMADTAGPVMTEQLGDTVTYHPSVGDDVSFVAIIAGKAADLAEAVPGLSSDVRTGTLLVLKTELATPTRDDQVTIRSKKWTVVTFEDRSYAWVLNIREADLVEFGPGRIRMARV